jgi:dihydrofolate reductase
LNQGARPVAASAPSRPTLAIIAAVARNRVIGKDNALPWRLPEDLRRFRALTTGHPIIMGRRTHQSLGRPPPERRNIVISRNPDFTADPSHAVG